MKKYRFEFDKFVKDLERRGDKNRQRIAEESNDLNDQELKREKLKRYHEHPHNSVVYKKKEENDRETR